jgi:tRNA(fMet)-specific endonuclease VapC
MPVLDSSFIVDLLRGNEEAFKKLAEMVDEYAYLSTTEINVLELYRGASLHENKPKPRKNQVNTRVFSCSAA